ncbi:MAG: cation:proton antiporter, partial [Chthoniobacterales bacterium]|nr:cation:proton antiporter [Chthoniobacterales bacterium]
SGETSLTTSLSIAMGIGKAFLAMSLLLGAVLIAANYLLPPLLRYFSPSPATIFLLSLGWCFAVVSVAHSLELSLELGAFFAGLSLAQSPHSRDLQHRIKPLMNFFIAVFFVTLGAGVSLGNASREILPILILTLFVLLGKPLTFIPIISKMGYSERTSLFSSITLAQVSEFSFLLTAMCVQIGISSQRIIDITAFVGILTIAISVYFILYNQNLYIWCKKIGLLSPFQTTNRTTKEEDSLPLAQRSNHIIVVGMNSLGRQIVRQLCARGEKVIALDTDPHKLENLPCETMLGSSEFLDVLLDAGLPRAKLLISALQIEEANELLAFRARQYGVPCAIHTVDESVAENLLDLDVSYLMLSKVDGIKLQNSHLKKLGVLH